MNKRITYHLAHAENRVHICLVNRQLWEAKGDELMVEAATRSFYDWIGRAEHLHQEDHF